MPEFKSNTIEIHIARICEAIPNFLMLKRSPAKDLYPGIWQSVTGRIEPNETALRAAVREMKEETGLNPLKLWTLPHLGTFFNPVSDSVNFVPSFGALVDSTAEPKLSSEHTEYLWVEKDSAIKLLAMASHKKSIEIFYDYILVNNSGLFIAPDHLWK